MTEDTKLALFDGTKKMQASPTVLLRFLQVFNPEVYDQAVEAHRSGFYSPSLLASIFLTSMNFGELEERIMPVLCNFNRAVLEEGREWGANKLPFVPESAGYYKRSASPFEYVNIEDTCLPALKLLRPMYPMLSIGQNKASFFKHDGWSDPFNPILELISTSGSAQAEGWRSMKRAIERMLHHSDSLVLAFRLLVQTIIITPRVSVLQQKDWFEVIDLWETLFKLYDTYRAGVPKTILEIR